MTVGSIMWGNCDGSGHARRARRLPPKGRVAIALGGFLILPTAVSSAHVGAPERIADADISTGSAIGPSLTPAVALDAPSRVPTGLPLTRPVVAEQYVGDDIPLPARWAYLRAAAVMGDVAPECGIRWTLVAAVGRVESDHGRYAGARLDADGVARPSIFGVTLDGRGRRARVPDTDDGGLDGTTRWDRAVGPMQFIPSTWAVVGVDGDADGSRSPHDIDDAALAASVYLCADSANLTTRAHMRGALLRYNRSAAYAALVLAYEHGYRTDAPAAPSPGATMVATGSPSAAAPDRADVRKLLTKVDRRPVQRSADTRPDAARSSVTAAGAAPSAESHTRPTASASDRPARSATHGPAPTDGPTAVPTDGPTTDPELAPPLPPPPPPPPPSPEPEPDAQPDPDPEPKPEPSQTVTVTGLWALCGEAYCVSDIVLDLSGIDLTAAAAGDHDGDGVATDNAAEFRGLERTTVELVGVQTPAGLAPLTVNGTPLVTP